MKNKKEILVMINKLRDEGLDLKVDSRDDLKKLKEISIKIDLLFWVLDWEDKIK